MKRSNLFLAAITALAMTGCNDVPEDVISRTEERQARESAAAEDSKAYAESDFDPYAKVSLSEVKAELNGYKFKAHDNLNFICEPMPVETNEVYELDMTYGLNESVDPLDENRLKNALNQFCRREESDYEIVNNGSYLSAISNEVLIGQVFHNCSSFLLQNYDNTAVLYGEGRPVYYNKENYPKEKLKMADGEELSVNEAMEQGRQYINQLHSLDMFDSNEEQKLYRIALADIAEKGYIIGLHYQQYRYGLPLDDSGKEIASNTRKTFFELWFSRSGKIIEANNYCSVFEKTKRKVDSLIPLSSAEYLAASNLAPHLSYDVSEVQLRYFCFFEDPLHPDEILYYRPTWCFTLYEYPTVTDKNFRFERTMLYVDAENGEVYYSDGYNSTFIKNGERTN